MVEAGLPAMMDGLDDYIDARIRAGIESGKIDPKYGTITSADPVAVRLDGAAAALEYSPPCLYRPVQGDRVWCVVWGTSLVIVGPVSPPAAYDDGWTDPGWTNCSFYTPNGFAQSSGADKAQVRELGNRVHLRGSFRRTASGGGFGNGCLVGLPQSPQTQHVGTAQWESGARCDLVIYAGDTEVVPDIIASWGTFGPGWVRISAGAGYTLDPW